MAARIPPVSPEAGAKGVKARSERTGESITDKIRTLVHEVCTGFLIREAYSSTISTNPIVFLKGPVDQTRALATALGIAVPLGSPRKLEGASAQKEEILEQLTVDQCSGKCTILYDVRETVLTPVFLNFVRGLHPSSACLILTNEISLPDNAEEEYATFRIELS